MALAKEGLAVCLYLELRRRAFKHPPMLRRAKHPRIRSAVATSCVVTATKLASDGFLSATSAEKTFRFAAGCADLVGSWSVIAPTGGGSATVTFAAPTNPLGWTSFTAKIKEGKNSSKWVKNTTTLSSGTFSFKGLNKKEPVHNVYVVTGTDTVGCTYTSTESTTS